MHIRFLVAVWCGKFTSFLLRIAGSGGGALPGLVAQRIAPDFLTLAAHQCHNGVILVAGTNGKTTTSRMIASFLGSDLVYNRSGSNLTRGHVAAFLSKTNWFGKVHASYALLEVDEAVLPESLRLVRPTVVLLHNLFRDQLDRYGEVDTIAAKWLQALSAYLPAESNLIINADDPHLAALALQSNHALTTYYGLNDPLIGTPEPTATVDAYLSPISKKPLHYEYYYLSHLGVYHEPGFSRPNPNLTATGISFDSAGGKSTFTYTSSSEALSVILPLPGLYNVYNALAALTAGTILNIPTSTTIHQLAQFKSVFGRFERIDYNGKTITLCLIKNPVGASEVLRTVASDKSGFSLGFFMNDNFADGTDISWYWDTPFEIIAGTTKTILCSGSRAADIALRLKYAGHSDQITVTSKLSQAFDQLLAEPNQSIYILSTYTATLELQAILKQREVKSEYWKE